MTEDYVAVIARTVAPRVCALRVPSQVFDEIDISIRKGIQEFRRRSNEPDRLQSQFLYGYALGLASGLVSATVGGVVVAMVLK